MPSLKRLRVLPFRELAWLLPAPSALPCVLIGFLWVCCFTVALNTSRSHLQTAICYNKNPGPDTLSVHDPVQIVENCTAALITQLVRQLESWVAVQAAGFFALQLCKYTLTTKFFIIETLFLIAILQSPALPGPPASILALVAMSSVSPASKRVFLGWATIVHLRCNSKLQCATWILSKKMGNRVWPPMRTGAAQWLAPVAQDPNRAWTSGSCPGQGAPGMSSWCLHSHCLKMQSWGARAGKACEGLHFLLPLFAHPWCSSDQSSHSPSDISRPCFAHSCPGMSSRFPRKACSSWLLGSSRISTDFNRNRGKDGPSLVDESSPLTSSPLTSSPLISDTTLVSSHNWMIARMHRLHWFCCPMSAWRTQFMPSDEGRKWPMLRDVQTSKCAY